MPVRSPNQLLGGRKEDMKPDDGLYYVDSDATSTCSTSRGIEKDDHYSLAMAKREIKRLREAIKSLESCIKNRKPDTSAAWQTEAEQAKSESSKLKKDYEDLLKELSAAKDALSQQVLSGKEEIEEAVAKERSAWKERLAAAHQDIEDVRNELQQTHSRYEEAELSKTSALFDLTQERNKIHPRGVDHEIHQGVLSELNMTRTRLKQQEALSSETEQRSKAEVAACQAEIHQSSSYLKRMIKEMKAEVSQATEAAAESDAKVTKLSAELRRMSAHSEALQAENTNLVQSQEKWQVWFDELEQNLKSEGRRRFGFSDELIAVRQRLKQLEETADKAVSETFSKTLSLVGKAPKHGI